MSLLISKTGILTTVQDLGRTGHCALGINPSGVMDRASTMLINTLLGNPESEALLELHYPAGEFIFETECSFVIGGADFGATLNEIEIPNWKTITPSEGDVLRFTAPRNGSRSYLAVAGGFEVDNWLGSKSTNLTANAGGFYGRRLAKGDRIGFAAPRRVSKRALGPSLIPRYSRFPIVRVIAGAEYDILTAKSEQDLLSGGFTLTNDLNRMGYRLKGPKLHLLHEKEMVSAAVTFGTVQLLPDGQLIVLMADHQTSGGYPRVGNVIDVDLPLLAQISAGDRVSFHLTTIEEAEEAKVQFERELAFLRTGLSFRN
jgi:antagonist of KipI